MAGVDYHRRRVSEATYRIEGFYTTIYDIVFDNDRFDISDGTQSVNSFTYSELLDVFTRVTRVQCAIIEQTLYDITDIPISNCGCN